MARTVFGWVGLLLALSLALVSGTHVHAFPSLAVETSCSHEEHGDSHAEPCVWCHLRESSSTADLTAAELLEQTYDISLLVAVDAARDCRCKVPAAKPRGPPLASAVFEFALK